MKKSKTYLFFALFLIVSVFFTSPTSIFAQDPTDYDRAMDEYSQKIEDYNKAHSDYVFKRAQYLRYETLTSRSEAQEATLLMLEARDDVAISYLNALKEKLKESKGIGQENRDLLNAELDTEIAWYSEHRGVLSSAGSLEDLVKDSNEAKTRYAQTSSLAYKLLSNVSNGALVDYRDRMNNIFESLKSKIEKIKNEQREDYQLSFKKVETIDRWIFEGENRVIRAEERHLDAELAATEMLTKSKVGSGNYNNVVKILTEAKLFYKEASTLLKEVIREVKIAEK